MASNPVDFDHDPVTETFRPQGKTWLDKQFRGVSDSFETVGDNFLLLDNRVESLEGRVTSLEGRVTALEGRVTALEGRVTALEGRMDAAEQRLDTLEQDIQDWKDFSIQFFSFGSYLSKYMPADTPDDDIGAGWNDLDFITTEQFLPRGIVNETLGQFSFYYGGVYRISLVISFNHNEAQQGRTTTIRLYNHTDGVANQGVEVLVARNAITTTFSASLLVEITDDQKDKRFGFQIGGGDDVTAVTFTTAGYDINAISEWREPVS